jgi:hypothetical protein
MLQLSSDYARFGAITAGLLMIQVFWDVTLYRLEFTAYPCTAVFQTSSYTAFIMAKEELSNSLKYGMLI